MATNDTGTKLKRKRGRPSAHKEESPRASTYNGPSADEVYAMSDLEVTEAFKKLGEEPLQPLRWFEGEPLIIGDEPYIKPRSAVELNRACNKAHLLRLYLDQWIFSLDDTRLLVELEKLSGEQLSESAKRYAKRNDLQEQVLELLWPIVVKEEQKTAAKRVQTEQEKGQ